MRRILAASSLGSSESIFRCPVAPACLAVAACPCTDAVAQTAGDEPAIRPTRRRGSSLRRRSSRRRSSRCSRSRCRRRSRGDLPARRPTRRREPEGDRGDAARRNCARAGRRCSPTGCATRSRPTKSGPRATSPSARASTGSRARKPGSSATPRSGFSPSPSFISARTRRAASASEIQFIGPNHYDVKDASYTTCVAGNDDWYLRRGRRRSRSLAAGRHRARRDASSSRARRSCIRRISTFRCPTSASRDS